MKNDLGITQRSCSWDHINVKEVNYESIAAENCNCITGQNIKSMGYYEYFEENYFTICPKISEKISRKKGDRRN